MIMKFALLLGYSAAALGMSNPTGRGTTFASTVMSKPTTNADNKCKNKSGLKKVVLSMDGSIDDVMALVYLAKHPTIDIKGIVFEGTGGASTSNTNAAMFLRLMRMLGLHDVPWGAGPSTLEPRSPDCTNNAGWSPYKRGSDLLAGKSHLLPYFSNKPERQPWHVSSVDLNSVEVYKKAVEEGVETVFTTGPMTSLAQFRQHAPEEFRKLTTHVSMAGGAPGWGNAFPWNCNDHLPINDTIGRRDCRPDGGLSQGNSLFHLVANNQSETNIWSDIFSAKLVLEDPLGPKPYMVGGDIDGLPFDGTHEQGWMVKQLKDSNAKEANFVGEVLDAYSRDTDQFAKGFANNAWCPCDAQAAFGLVDLAHYEWASEPLSVKYTPVETDGIAKIVNCNTDGVLVRDPDAKRNMSYAVPGASTGTSWREHWLDVVTSDCIEHMPPSVQDLYDAWAGGNCKIGHGDDDDDDDN